MNPRRFLPALALLLALAAPAAGEETAKVTLRWKATDGDGNYGYLIYRAASRQGPYLRINPQLVHTPADGAKEHSYVYEDAAVKPGETWYYYVDTIDRSGVKRRFSGVLPKTVPTPGVVPSAPVER